MKRYNFSAVFAAGGYIPPSPQELESDYDHLAGYVEEDYPNGAQEEYTQLKQGQRPTNQNNRAVTSFQQEYDGDITNGRPSKNGRGQNKRLLSQKGSRNTAYKHQNAQNQVSAPKNSNSYSAPTGSEDAEGLAEGYNLPRESGEGYNAPSSTTNSGLNDPDSNREKSNTNGYTAPSAFTKGSTNARGIANRENSQASSETADSYNAPSHDNIFTQENDEGYSAPSDNQNGVSSGQQPSYTSSETADSYNAPSIDDRSTQENKEGYNALSGNQNGVSGRQQQSNTPNQSADSYNAPSQENNEGYNSPSGNQNDVSIRQQPSNTTYQSAGTYNIPSQENNEGYNAPSGNQNDVSGRQQPSNTSNQSADSYNAPSLSDRSTKENTGGYNAPSGNQNGVSGRQSPSYTSNKSSDSYNAPDGSDRSTNDNRDSFRTTENKISGDPGAQSGYNSQKETTGSYSAPGRTSYNKSAVEQRYQNLDNAEESNNGYRAPATPDRSKIGQGLTNRYIPSQETSGDFNNSGNQNKRQRFGTSRSTAEISDSYSATSVPKGRTTTDSYRSPGGQNRQKTDSRKKTSINKQAVANGNRRGNQQGAPGNRRVENEYGAPNDNGQDYKSPVAQQKGGASNNSRKGSGQRRVDGEYSAPRENVGIEEEPTGRSNGPAIAGYNAPNNQAIDSYESPSKIPENSFANDEVSGNSNGLGERKYDSDNENTDETQSRYNGSGENPEQDTYVAGKNRQANGAQNNPRYSSIQQDAGQGANSSSQAAYDKPNSGSNQSTYNNFPFENLEQRQKAQLCPGDSLESCVGICPGETTRVYAACVVSCGNRCTL